MVQTGVTIGNNRLHVHALTQHDTVRGINLYLLIRLYSHTVPVQVLSSSSSHISNRMKVDFRVYNIGVFSL